MSKTFLKPPPYPQWLTGYELECLKWYVDETFTKAEAFRKKHPKIKYYEINIEDLNSSESILQMLAYFGCTGKESLLEQIGKPTNLKRYKI